MASKPSSTRQLHQRTAAAVQKTRPVEKVGTTICDTQKDTARAMGAKLASLKGILWVGVVMFLFGIATLA